MITNGIRRDNTACYGITAGQVSVCWRVRRLCPVTPGEGSGASGDFSVFSGSREKQHLPHQEPPYAEQGEAGHSKGPYLPVHNNSGLRSSWAVCPDPPFLGAGVWVCIPMRAPPLLLQASLSTSLKGKADTSLSTSPTLSAVFSRPEHHPPAKRSPSHLLTRKSFTRFLA